jgi:predicted alpha/beta-hydrolase family hydrolase
VILQRPANAFCLYVMAHGAGAGMRHPFMQAVADALEPLGVATLRYDFPYMSAGKRRIDPPDVLDRTVREAVERAAREGLPLFAGGKSFGGRMTSQAQVRAPLPGVLGLAFIGFPLHPARKPATARADHLREVRVPMLFLQGTRDELAEPRLLRSVMSGLPLAKLCELEGADHAFHVPKGRNAAAELAEALATWAPNEIRR